VGERGLSAQPLGVVAGGGQQLSSMIDPDRVPLQQPGCGPADQLGEALVGEADLLVELVAAAGDRTQRRLAGCTGSARAASSGRNRTQVATNAATERWSRSSRSRAGALTSSPWRWLMAAVRASGGTAPHRPKRPDGLHDAVAALGRRGGRTGHHRAGGGLGVDRIRRAALAAGAPVWPVDLHHGDVLIQQEPGQAGAVAAGAVDPDRVWVPVATQPAQQLPGASTVGGELPVAQQSSLLVDDGGVVGAAVGVHPADDHPGALGHAGTAVPLQARARTGTHRPGGRTHQ
jgi:hypothetical protein